MRRFALSMLIVLAATAAGCAKTAPPPMERLAPEAPAARGLPARQPSDTPSPLQTRPPFGLYAHYPSNDTLATLSTGAVSPDGRYRSAMTQQGAWIARVDGAWLWQVQLAAPAPPPAPPELPGTQLAKPPIPPPPAKPPVVMGPLQWTSGARLLFRDDTGAWHLADPVAAKVTPLAPALKGKEGLQFSPDGRQVLYYAPTKTGTGLYVAAADGTNPKLMGENVTGFWQEPGGTLVVQKPTAAAADRNKAPGADPLLNAGLQKQ